MAKRDMTVAEALLLVLDQVDYTKGACTVNEPVGGVLSVQVINLARKALEDRKSRYNTIIKEVENAKGKNISQSNG